MRLIDYAAGGKTIAASTTVQFTGSDVPSNGVVAYFFGMSGNNTLAQIARIRVKANGTTFYDLPPSMLRAWIARFSQGCIAIPASTTLDPLGGAGNLIQHRRFTIPFFDVSQPTEDMADLYGFPRNSQPTIEIQFGGGAGAGTIFCGWIESSITPMAYPKLLSSQMNLANNLATAKYPFVEDGIVKGVGINTIGNGRTKVQCDGVQVFHAQGQITTDPAFTGDSLILESQQLANNMAAEAAGTGGLPNAITDPTFLKLSQPRVGTPGRSFLELTTLNNWAGVANEACIYSQVTYAEFRAKRSGPSSVAGSAMAAG